MTSLGRVANRGNTPSFSIGENSASGEICVETGLLIDIDTVLMRSIAWKLPYLIRGDP